MRTTKGVQTPSVSGVINSPPPDGSENSYNGKHVLFLLFSKTYKQDTV